MFLLDDILLAPIKGLLWLGENINKAVEKELGDESTLKEKLMELQFKYELRPIYTAGRFFIKTTGCY